MPWKIPLAGKLIAMGKVGAAAAAYKFGQWKYRNAMTRAKRGTKRTAGVRVGRYALSQKRYPWIGWDTAIRGKLMPNWQFKTFTWCMDDALNTSAVQGQTGIENAYALNDIFAPSRTSGAAGANHNAYGHDQMTTFYGRYMVHRLRMTLTVYTENTNEVLSCVSHIGPPGDTQSTTTRRTFEVEEWPGTEVVRIAPSGEHKWEVNKHFSIAAIAGGGKSFDDTNFGANFGTSPTSFPVFRIAFANMSSAAVVTVRYSLKLEFYTKIFDRKTLALSA